MYFHQDFIFPQIKHLVIDKSFPGVSHKYKASDDPEVVENNLNYIKEYLKVDELVLLNQIHGNQSLIVDDKNITEFKKRKDGDSLVTSSKNIALAILTADCIPMLFIDPENMVIGIAHAGWRGARYGIIEETISKMQKIGADVSEISALIGPCIHQKSYEIDSSFYDNFINESGHNKQFFINSIKSGHYMFDLPGYAKAKLSNNGIKDICQIEYDTFSSEELYPSYRRSRLQNMNSEESILSIIMLS